MDNGMKTPPEIKELDSHFIAPENNENLDKSDYNVWQSVKRIDLNLDLLLEKFNIAQSQEVQVYKEPSTMEDYDFLLLFPLNNIENVIELESRLSDDTSDFKKKLVRFITPTYDVSTSSDLKRMVRTILRRLFTYNLASSYSWRGFRGNFQIGNLKIVKVIFDISKYKFKNASKPYINVYIKEWIRYAKQRRNQLKKINGF